jgi:hypothetical protein
MDRQEGQGYTGIRQLDERTRAQTSGGISASSVLLAISLTTGDLQVFCTGLCQRGVTSADFLCHVPDNSQCDKRPPRRCRKLCHHRDTRIIWTGQSSGCSSFRSRQPTVSQISRNGSRRRLIGRRVSVEPITRSFAPCRLTASERKLNASSDFRSYSRAAWATTAASAVTGRVGGFRLHEPTSAT